MDMEFRAVMLAGALVLAACGATATGEDRSGVPGNQAPPTTAAHPREAEALDELLRASPQGSRILAAAHGDINADGTPDAVVALSHGADDGSHGEEFRSLLLLVRDTGGQLRLAARNDRIIPCRTCGGSLGEPSIHLDADSGSFMLRTEGGTGWLWSNEYLFRQANGDRWTLASIRESAQHRTSDEATSSELTAGDFGVIDFTGFDPATVSASDRLVE